VSKRGIRLGVIGAGHWGRNIVRTCAELDVLAGAADVDAAARGELHKSYPGLPLYEKPADLHVDGIDGIIVASPAELHAELAIAALTAGKHVFVEKPMALSLEDGRRMAALAERERLQLFVGHLMLYHAAVRRLRALIADGLIGRVWHVRSRRLNLGRLRKHESVWWSFAPHDIAMALAIMGEEPVLATAAQAGWLSARIPDTAYANFQFSNGRSAHIEVGWLDPQRTARLDVFGTEGVLTFESFGEPFRLTLCLGGARPDDQGVLKTWRGESQEIPVEPADPLRQEILAFLTSIRFGIPAETDAKEGLAVLRALTMADEASARSPAHLEALA